MGSKGENNQPRAQQGREYATMSVKWVDGYCCALKDANCQVLVTRRKRDSNYSFCALSTVCGQVEGLACLPLAP
jgi:hypothetical protein